MSATEYVLLAEVFYLRQGDGSRKRYRTGDVIEGLNDERVERLLKAGAIARPGDVPAESEPDVAEEAGESDEVGDKPADATKPELVEWIYANVAKEDGSDYTKTELRQLSPDELRDIVRSVD